MNRKTLFLSAAVMAVLLLAACSPQSVPPADTPLPPADAAQGADAAAADEQSAPSALDGQALYEANGCANCHGQNREGVLAPALLPERLTKDPGVYINTITNGRGRMPTFGKDLTAQEIEALVQWLMAPVE